MKIELLGKTHLVRSVSVATVGVCTEVIINCAERWPFAQRVGGSVLYASQFTGALPDHDCLAVVATSDDSLHDEPDTCHIVLVPENNEDRVALRGLSFSNIEKDQVTFIYVPKALLAHKCTLATKQNTINF